MAPRIIARPAGGFIHGPLPKGCAFCSEGSKMVLFVTGVCHYKCFYCPISEEKRMASDAWANERRVTVRAEYAAWTPGEPATPELEAIAEEAVAMGARGTGITGGDPMYDPPRTLRYIRFLKERFGAAHHIHMYTQIPFDIKWLAELQAAGLDEIRFHTPDEVWPALDEPKNARYKALYLEAKRMEDAGQWDVGFEIPCIPGALEPMSALAAWLVAHGFKFLNVNEMEFSETNYPALLARGYRIVDDVTSRAVASEDVAHALVEQFAASPLTVHFCSSPFKDAIQLRERLKRRAASVALPHEEVTEDGTLIRGVVECPDPRDVAREMAEAFEIPADLVHVRAAAEIGRGALLPDERIAVATTGREISAPHVIGGRPVAKRDRLEVAPWVLEEIAAEIPFPCYLSEVYPTSDELEVERTPLNSQ
ncbi:MAG: radical SAM protein [Thermoplasmatota archaeon]